MKTGNRRTLVFVDVLHRKYLESRKKTEVAARRATEKSPETNTSKTMLQRVLGCLCCPAAHRKAK
jgi:hypothetical protein